MRAIVTLRRLLGAVSVVVGLAGCGPGGPEYVYVPGPGFEQALVARAELPDSGGVRAGEWVTLHANRVSGPWQRVRRAEVADTVLCMQNTVRPSPEIGVEANVRWQVTPAVEPEWNQPGPPDFRRQVRFSTPGTYELRAVSTGCGGDFSSLPVRIVVR